MDAPDNTEFELKFIVPPQLRAKVFAEVTQGAGFQGRQSLVAMYLDTPDGRLAAAGLAWRLRRENRRWVQTLKAAAPGGLLRFEHEVLRPDASPDASMHAGTPVGERLLLLLHQARNDGLEAEVRFRTEVRRFTRVLRSRGAVVELAFDEGHIEAGGLKRRVLELEFESVSGPRGPMLALARRWQRRFGLLLDPYSKSERGSLLAEGRLHPPVRKSAAPCHGKHAGAGEVFGAVLDECLDQVLRNTAGLCDGAHEQRVDHVHQLRVGLRRLRCALRIFRGWVQEPPEPLVQGLRQLFAELGRTRDADVLDNGVAQALAKAGAPPLPPRAATASDAPGGLARASGTQRLLLDWLAWRVTEFDPAHRPHSPSDAVGHDAPEFTEVTQALAELSSKRSKAHTETPEARLRRLARKRLRSWHQSIARQVREFDGLDDVALHGLRKRIKRQRYAVEFLAPLWSNRAMARYLRRLAAAQECMGELNDLLVARAHYQARVDDEPQAWFALGWLASRIAQTMAKGRPAVQALAKAGVHLDGQDFSRRSR